MSAPTAGASGQSSDKMPAFAVNAASFGADFVVQEFAHVVDNTGFSARLAQKLGTPAHTAHCKRLIVTLRMRWPNNGHSFFRAFQEMRSRTAVIRSNLSTAT